MEMTYRCRGHHRELEDIRDVVGDTVSRIEDEVTAARKALDPSEESDGPFRPAPDIGPEELEKLDALLESWKAFDASIQDVDRAGEVGPLVVAYGLQKFDTTIRFEGCGHDLAELIATAPVDGARYAYDCPECGAEHTVRRIPEDPEGGEDAEDDSE